MKRRNVIKGLALLPVAGTVLSPQSVFSSSESANKNGSTLSNGALAETTESSFMAEAIFFAQLV